MDFSKATVAAASVIGLTRRLEAVIKAYDSQRARRFDVKNVIYTVTALLPVFI
jgi:hypothetical protein